VLLLPVPVPVLLLRPLLLPVPVPGVSLRK
jgi:hypothetical protein